MKDAMTDAEFAAINGALDAATTKPKPPKGEHRTRLNAYKHGLTGQVYLFSESERKAFNTHRDGIVAVLAPVGALEVDLAQSIAENRWRLRRICAIEAGIFAVGLTDARLSSREDAEQFAIDEASTKARTWLFKADKFQLLALYESRINRTVERNMAELRTLQGVRQAARDKALQEARALAQHAKSKGETYDPARDFPPELIKTDSDFSLAAIARHLRVNEAMDYTKSLPKNRANPKPGATMPVAA